jgi:hypothetical protein
MKKYISLGAIVLVVIGLIYGIVYIADGKKSGRSKAISYNRDIRPILSDTPVVVSLSVISCCA